MNLYFAEFRIQVPLNLADLNEIYSAAARFQAINEL